MTPRVVLSVIAIGLAAAAGCATDSTAPSASGGSLTASVVAPRPTAPATGAQIKNGDQPVSLVVQNAISTGTGTTYTFEVSSDASFATKVQTRDGVAESSSGQTSVKLDSLAAAKDYYWHARATSGGTVGAFGPTYKFTIGPSITLSTPVPISPLTNAQTGSRPALRVTNVTRTGPAGAISYRFEVSTSSSFSVVAVTGIVNEAVNETAFIPPADLTNGTLYFWRAFALDIANGISSLPSSTQSFTPVNPLWPGAVPPGTPGHARLGPGWAPQTVVSFDGHVFDSPPIDEQRVFDLLDKGFDPQGALNWMNSNGYPTVGVYYPGPLVIGFPYTYMALINGAWELVIRSGG
jgi:hypothetical protein